MQTTWMNLKTTWMNILGETNSQFWVHSINLHLKRCKMVSTYDCIKQDHDYENKQEKNSHLHHRSNICPSASENWTNISKIVEWLLATTCLILDFRVIDLQWPFSEYLSRSPPLAAVNLYPPLPHCCQWELQAPWPLPPITMAELSPPLWPTAAGISRASGMENDIIATVVVS
jgi:hypothetical protein